MSIRVNIDPLEINITKTYKGTAIINNKEWSFHYRITKDSKGVESVVDLDEQHYKDITKENEEEKWDEMNIIEKQIEDNINYNDVW